MSDTLLSHHAEVDFIPDDVLRLLLDHCLTFRTDFSLEVRADATRFEKGKSGGKGGGGATLPPCLSSLGLPPAPGVGAGVVLPVSDS